MDSAARGWLDGLTDRWADVRPVSTASEFRIAYDIEMAIVSRPGSNWRYGRSNFPDLATYLQSFPLACLLPCLLIDRRSSRPIGLAFIHSWMVRDGRADLAVCATDGSGTAALMGALRYIRWVCSEWKLRTLVLRSNADSLPLCDGLARFGFGGWNSTLEAYSIDVAGFQSFWESFVNPRDDSKRPWLSSREAVEDKHGGRFV